jgi:hypothetical protein
VQLQKTEADQESESDASIKIFESRELINGVDAKVKDVKFETRLRIKEKIQGEFEKTRRNLGVIEGETKRERFEEPVYVDNQEVKDAMKSRFINSEIVDDEVRNHINTNTIRNDRELYLHKNPNECEGSKDSEDIFYRCEVEHVVKANLSDEWSDDRILENKFPYYQRARNFYNRIKSLQDKRVELTHNGSHFSIKTETDKITDDSNSHLNISTYKRSVSAGFGLGLVSALIGLGVIPTLFIVSFVLFLDHFQAYSKKQEPVEFYMSSTPDNKDIDSISTSKLKDYSVSERFVEKINVDISDEHTELHPESVDTKWVFGKVSNMLPNKDAVEFFDSIGLENIEDNQFEAVVEKRSTIPERNCKVSVCGQWYIYPKDEFDGIESS